jgi:hypothetical protein
MKWSTSGFKKVIFAHVEDVADLFRNNIALV